MGDPQFTALLQEAQALTHPWRIGELALGQLSRRSEILGLLSNLPQAKVATEAEVMTLVETRRLFGLGIGYVDAHLLRSEERRVGKECRSRWSPYHHKNNIQ